MHVYAGYSILTLCSMGRCRYVISLTRRSSCGEPSYCSLSCCESLSYFPSLIKQQRLLSSAAKGAQMSLFQNGEAEQNGQEGEKQGEAEARAEHQCFHRPRHTHKVSQNTSRVLRSSCDAFIVLWPGVKHHPPSPVISQNGSYHKLCTTRFYIDETPKDLARQTKLCVILCQTYEQDVWKDVINHITVQACKIIMSFQMFGVAPCNIIFCKS